MRYLVNALILVTVAVCMAVGNVMVAAFLYHADSWWAWFQWVPGTLLINYMVAMSMYHQFVDVDD